MKKKIKRFRGFQTQLEWFAAAMLEEENNRILFHWEKSFIFMQIAFNLSFFLLQHGHHEHTVLFALVIVSQTTNLMHNRIDLSLK